MSRRFVVRTVALQEIFEAAEWYGARGTGLSAEFLHALDDVIASVKGAPEQYPKVHGEMGHALLRRFPYSIIFKASDEEIVVLACTHWRRSLRKWQNRK